MTAPDPTSAEPHAEPHAEPPATEPPAIGPDGADEAAVAASGAPWAMQLVLRDERVERPTHLAACEAAASAVVTLLADPRAAGDGPWAARVRHWADGRVRKVVRRARGARYTGTEPIGHVEVLRRGASVRAFVPGPTDLVPHAVSKLQVGGTQVPETGEPAPEVPGGLTIALTPLTELTTGKAAAQCGHAAQFAWASMPAAAREAWRDTGFAVRVEQPGEAAWADAAATWPVTIRDGGFTEVAPGTMTVAARW